MRPIYVCMSTDENYVPLASVAISSLLESNKKASSIEIFLLDSGITKKSKNILINQVEKYSRKINFIDVTSELEELKKIGTNSQGSNKSYASYSRFFIIDNLPDYVDKLLYVDCDICICEELSDLFEINLENYWLGAVIDILPNFHKENIDFESCNLYFNAGVLLFNCSEWKKNNVLKRIKKHLLTIGCKYSFHDQDIINLVCKEKIYTLPPKYMVFLPEYTWGKKGVLQLSDLDKNTYYEEEDLKEACDNPIIIHYVDSILGRPWYKGCNSIYFNPWNQALEKSPFNGRFSYVNKKFSYAHLFLRKIYFIFPKNLFIEIHKRRKNKVLLEREKKYEKKHIY